MTPLVDPTIERAYVGLALIDGEAAQRVATIAQCFGDGGARRVALAIADVVASGQHPAEKIVANALGGTDADRALVVALIGESSGIGFGDAPADIVVRDWMRREAKTRAERHMRDIMSGEVGDVQAALNAFSADIERISPARTGGIMSLSDAVHEAGEALMLRAQTGRIAGVPTGNRWLDTILDGWLRGGLSIFAARPGMGKSSWWAQHLVEMGRQGVKALLFSPEDSADTIGARLIAQGAKINKYTATAGDAGRIAEVRDSLAGLPIRICDLAGMTVPQMRQVAREQARELGGLDCVVIDHGGYILNDGVDNVVDRIGQTNKRLAAWAREDELAMVMVWQLKRATAERADKFPELPDLRDSGHLEQDARAVVFIHRPAYYEHGKDTSSRDPQTAHIVVAKNNSGAIGSRAYTFVPGEMRYYEQSPTDTLPRPQNTARSWHDEGD